MTEAAERSVTHHLLASSYKGRKKRQQQKLKQEARKKQNPDVSRLREEEQLSCWAFQ